MKRRVPTALSLAFLTASAAAADAGPCAHGKQRNCLNLPATVNFSSVPDISDQIVGGEQAAQPPPAPVIAAPQPVAPYTGPMVGISTKARAPTVGYYWSIN
jgi:hypothetical protein